MIGESYEWKKAIKLGVRYVRRHRASAILDGNDHLLERIHIRLLSIAVVGRRLLETPKVATRLRKVEVPVNTYRYVGTLVDYMNTQKIDRHYDLAEPVADLILGRDLWNQVIHSFVWIWTLSESQDELGGFLVSSDREKESRLIEVDLADFFNFSLQVANSDPNHLQGLRNESGQWEWLAE